MRPAPRVQSTALLAALRAALLRLLYFGFGCVSILLLIVQLCFDVEIGFRLLRQDSLDRQASGSAGIPFLPWFSARVLRP